MNKLMKTLLAVAAFSASASAMADLPYNPEFKQGNGVLNVETVTYQGVQPASKDDDRVQLVPVVRDAAVMHTEYQPLRRTTAR